MKLLIKCYMAKGKKKKKYPPTPKSDKAKKWIGKKIKKLMKEGKKQDQAVAIALSMSRDKFK